VDAVVALPAGAAPGGIHLDHRRLLVPRHHAGRRDPHHRHGGDERLPQGLLGKILGLNGHLLVQPLESPLTDYQAVAERLSKLEGIRLAVPIVEGQALASSPFNAAGVLVRGIRGDDLNGLTSVAKNIKQGTLEGFDQGQGVVVGRRLADQLTLRAGDSVTLVSPAAP
jgi:ABC-type lipoprotein release transport system permease subunit